MNKLRVLVKKEMKELLRERIVLFGLLLGPLLMYLVMGGIASASFSQINQQAAYKPNIAIVTESGWKPGNITQILAQRLDSKIYTDASPEELLAKGYDAVLIIPRDFDSMMLSGEPVEVSLIYRPRSLSFIELSKPEQIGHAVETVVRNALAGYLKEYMPNIKPDFLANPVILNTSYYYKGKIVPYQQLFGLVMGVSLAIPLAVLMTAVASTQVAAISFGLEKEAKTLEKLFTLPISKRTLLLGKLIAVTILAIGGVISYMVGFYIYMKMVIGGVSTAGGGGSETIVTISLPSILLLLITFGLVLTLYTNIVIGFIIGSQAGDVRSSQMAASYISFILAIPLFPMFFGIDIARLPAVVLGILAIDPYALLALLTTAGISGNSSLMVLSSLGLIVHGIVWTIIATKLLSPETMIVGHPLLKRIVERFTRRGGSIIEE